MRLYVSVCMRMRECFCERVHMPLCVCICVCVYLSVCLSVFMREDEGVKMYVCVRMDIICIYAWMCIVTARIHTDRWVPGLSFWGCLLYAVICISIISWTLEVSATCHIADKYGAYVCVYVCARTCVRWWWWCVWDDDDVREMMMMCVRDDDDVYVRWWRWWWWWW